MSEDLSYREVRGVIATKGDNVKRIVLADMGHTINVTYVAGSSPELTPSEARCLARDLRRLARRIDARQAVKP